MLRRISGFLSLFDSLRAIRLESASAGLAGEGSLVVVRYRTSRPLPDDLRRHPPCLVDEASGARLPLQRVPYFGGLASRSVGPTASAEGYFVVDNSATIVAPGSRVTVIIGGLKKENVVVSG